MRYITEDMLRQLHKQKPFTSYDIPEGARLTPGAKGFLTDFMISFESDFIPEKNSVDTIPERKSEMESFIQGLDDYMGVIGSKLRLAALEVYYFDEHGARLMDKSGGYLIQRTPNMVMEILVDETKDGELSIPFLDFNPDSKKSLISANLNLIIHKFRMLRNSLKEKTGRAESKNTSAYIKDCFDALDAIDKLLIRSLIRIQGERSGE